MTQLQSRLRRYVSRLGILPLAFVAWRTVRSLSPATIRGNRAARRSSKLPIPPDSLIFSSTATRNVEWFLSSGEQFFAALDSALDAAGRPLRSFQRVLDFGCGSGRVLRHMANVEGPEFFGCDYNAQAVAWARQNLPFARFGLNKLDPPLPFDAGRFDLCYSVSVFTHLPEHMQRPWIEELHRVIAPRGLLVLTLSGRGDFTRLTPTERRRFDAGELIVLDAELAGTNMCGVFHPPTWVERHWGDLFRVQKHYPEGARGTPNQDLYVLQRMT